MRSLFIILIIAFFLNSAFARSDHPASPANPVTFSRQGNQFFLCNQKIRLKLTFENGVLTGEILQVPENARHFFNGKSPQWQSNGNFALDIQWTGWHASHKTNNAENPVLLSAKDFRLTTFSVKRDSAGARQLDLLFSATEAPFGLRLSYRLAPGAFWIEKQLTVSDSTYGYHFLRFIYPSFSTIKTSFKVIKSGGFGQPVVLRNKQSGFFSGLEYPIASNTFRKSSAGESIFKAGVEVGQKITAAGICSPWQVLALTPPHFEHLWFNRYLDGQRVAPVRPYVLYNSWYDLRSPAFKNIPKQNIMNETNIMRIIDLIEKNFVQKNGIHLDAFVLDDGWDVYASDWKLRPAQFPHGLTPISRRLQKMGTNLGLWFGPTGGYSFRMRRIRWMASHGYEVIAGHSDRNHAMMCVAGRHYSQLLKKRTTDFVQKDGVAFFKWDGIQFSCSEADHGHPVGLYSRRAVMDTVIALCKAVRQANPHVFLNITSGTWLSPWWVKYANQIWMQGGDYGYSDLPSISRRDAAITYRDNTLFRDFNVHHFYFPIANLMTHGIIKGQLQKLGGEREPIDKFTDNALLYFARGVSMWELYISPDILSEAEWKAIAQSMKWARDNFNILKQTFMIGGNPSKGSAYAYVHFNGLHGIVAARNPFIRSQTVTVPLSDTLGLSETARNLVLEQIYPYRWISPRLYKAGERITLLVAGYETAIYRIFPLNEAQRPLPANIIFSGQKTGARNYQMTAYVSTGPLRMLNPAFSRAMHEIGKKAEHIRFALPPRDSVDGLRSYAVSYGVNEITLRLRLKAATEGKLAILLQDIGENKQEILPQVHIKLNGKTVTPTVQKQDNRWAWLICTLDAAEHEQTVHIRLQTGDTQWQGEGQLWLISDRHFAGTRFSFETKKNIKAEVLPPLPRPAGTLHRNRLLTRFAIKGKQLSAEPPRF